MSFRIPKFGLVASVALLLLTACERASVDLPTPNTVIPTATPGVQPSPTAVIAFPEALGQTPATANVPTSANVVRGTPTPQPATTGKTGGQRTSASPASSPAETVDPVFYDSDGITLEYYWPSDDLGNLSADETEILVYNGSDATIEFVSPEMTFSENGSLRAQISGAWERFPSFASGDRIDYISIPPSPYQGDKLLVRPGERAKAHWHLESVSSSGTRQSMVIDLKVKTDQGISTINRTLVRNSGQVVVEAATVPGSTQEPQESQQTQDPYGTSPSTSATGDPSRVWWSFDGTTWSPNGAPPSCPEPFVLETPVDMNLVTNALWPGQQRGAYVAHGGFRFDASEADDVTVRAPIGAHLVRASRYLEGVDEQILLFFSAPCGFFYRFDHVRTASALVEDALKDIPPAASGDSRTSFINPPVWIEQGEVVATSVGIAPSNIFVDFGLYDVRTPNNVIPNPAWADLFAADKEFGHYGVCFFDYLPGSDGDMMRSLSTGTEGRTSDYCK